MVHLQRHRKDFLYSAVYAGNYLKAIFKTLYCINYNKPYICYSNLQEHLFFLKILGIGAVYCVQGQTKIFLHTSINEGYFLKEIYDIRILHYT